MAEVIKTIKSSGGDYTTLAGWESDASASSTNADPWWAEIYGDHNISTMIKSDWTEEPSGEGGRVRIYAAPGHDHDGTGIASSGHGAYSSSTSAWNIACTGANQPIGYFTFEGFLITTSKNTNGCVLISSGGEGAGIQFKRMYFQHTASTTGACVYIQTNSSSLGVQNLLMENCIINGGNEGLYMSTLSSSPAWTGITRNCTIYNTIDNGLLTGFTGSTTVTHTFQNLISIDNTDVDFIISFVDTLVIQNCISSDGTADDDGGTGHQVDVTAAELFTDAAGSDFSLARGSKASGTGVAIADCKVDYFGRRRPEGGAMDVGAVMSHHVGRKRVRPSARSRMRRRVRDVWARRG